MTTIQRTRGPRAGALVLFGVMGSLVTGGCSINRFAINQLGNGCCSSACS